MINNELLDFVEKTIQEQESTTRYMESLKQENLQLVKEIEESKNKLNSPYDSYQGDHDNMKHNNFDTFGGDSEDSVLRMKLKKAEEQVKMINEELQNLKNTSSIENKSKDQDIKNLTEKLQLSKKALDDSERCIQELESKFQVEIDEMRKSFEHSKQTAQDFNKIKDEYEKKLAQVIDEKENISQKYDQLRDNYNTLDATFSETQTELDQLKEKYNQTIANEVEKAKCAATNFEKENKNLTSLNKQQAETIEEKTDKIRELREQTQSMNSELLEAKNELDNALREINILNQKLEVSKSSVDRDQYNALEQDYQVLQQNYDQKINSFNEMKEDFGQKLNDFQLLSQDFNQCKRDLQDLEYKFKSLEAQKIEKDSRLKELSYENERLTDKIQQVTNQNMRKHNDEIDDLKRSYEGHVNKCILRANECARLVDQFNDAFLSFAKEDTFDKKMVSRKFRDFMILADKIKPAKEFFELEDVLNNVQEWVLHSAEEFEQQLKNATNFKLKLLQTSERVDTLEDYQQVAANEEKRLLKREEDLKKQVKSLSHKLEQIESEKSCSYKREDKVSRQLQTLKHDVKGYSRENTRLQAQIKAMMQEKDKLFTEIKEKNRGKDHEIKKNKDLEQRIFQLIYEKDSIMEMLGVLEKSIPSTEVRRLFTEFINNQKQLFSLEEDKNNMENTLLAKEKELRAVAKKEQLSERCNNLRKEVEVQRKELANIDSQMESFKSKIASLKDELHCVEIHEKRRNEVVFDTERNLLEKRDENEMLRREISYLNTSKMDIEKAYNALLEEKKMIFREYMALKSRLNPDETSMYSNKQVNMTSTLNPVEYSRQPLVPTKTHDYHTSHMLNPHESSSFVSPLGHTYGQNFYSVNNAAEQINEQPQSEYETEHEKIQEQSFETESNYENGKLFYLHTYQN